MDGCLVRYSWMRICILGTGALRTRGGGANIRVYGVHRDTCPFIHFYRVVHRTCSPVYALLRGGS